MSQRIHIIRQPRITILNELTGLTIEQLNLIPGGFRNNILWNLGHMVAAQHGITYKRAGLQLPIDEEFFETFKPGTKPERLYSEIDLQRIKELMLSSLDKLEVDLQTDMFGNYPAWVTRYGANIGNIDDAVAFLPFHEGLHIGVITALKKLV